MCLEESKAGRERSRLDLAVRAEAEQRDGRGDQGGGEEEEEGARQSKRAFGYKENE